MFLSQNLCCFEVKIKGDDIYPRQQRIDQNKKIFKTPFTYNIIFQQLDSSTEKYSSFLIFGENTLLPCGVEISHHTESAKCRLLQYSLLLHIIVVNSQLQCLHRLSIRVNCKESFVWADAIYGLDAGLAWSAPEARGPKSLNFPDGNFQRAKTFRAECVNRFRDKRKRVNRFRDKKTCANSFCDKKGALIVFATKKSLCKSSLQQNKCAQIIFATKKCA